MPLSIAYAESGQPTYDLHIPRLTVDVALKQLARQTETQLLYPHDLVKTLESNPVSGRYTVMDALNMMLRGTGLSSSLTRGGMVAVSQGSSTEQQEQGEDMLSNLNIGAGASRKRKSFLASVLAGVTAVFGSPGAVGQEQDEGEQNLLIEEIVVTAQKREERLMDVPISISAYTPEDFDKRGLRDFSDIAAITPGLHFNQGRGFANDITIRGISAQFAGAGTTAVYIDDIPMQIRTTAPSFASGTPKIFDLQRVEVLRGPQGTLFGTGAMGGAVRFITPQPSLTDSSMYARTEVSDTRGGGLGYEAGLAGGGPIIDDKLGFRASGWYRRDGGYIDHVSAVPGGANDENSNRADSFVGRVALTYAPTESLRITPAIYVQDVDTHDLSIYQPEASDSDDKRFVNTDLLLQPIREKMYVPSLKLEADIEDLGFLGDVTFTSISTYLHRDFKLGLDYTNVFTSIFGIPLPTSADEASPDIHQTKQYNFAQELRLSSADPEARLQWTFGGYYSLARQNGTQNIEGAAFPQQVLDTFGVTVEEFLGAGMADGTFLALIDQRNRDEQMAGFINLEYELLDDVSVVGGLRISRDENSFQAHNRGPLFGGLQTNSGGQEETLVTPKFGINYRPTENQLFYVSATKGFRAGGPNSPFIIGGAACEAEFAEVSAGLNDDFSYDADSLWNYELGSKSVLFNNRLNISASVFHIKWQDIQRNVALPTCTSRVIANLGEARSEGFDLAIDARLTDNLFLDLAAGYTSSEYSKDTTIADTTYVADGEQISTISPWNVTAALEYQFDVLAQTRGYVRVENRYNSRNDGRFPQQRLGQFLFVPEKINELNLRVGANWDQYEVSAFVNNILDDDPLLVFDPRFPSPPRGAFTARPLSFGLTAVYRW